MAVMVEAPVEEAAWKCVCFLFGSEDRFMERERERWGGEGIESQLDRQVGQLLMYIIKETGL